jgi:hypothetical protein
MNLFQDENNSIKYNLILPDHGMIVQSDTECDDKNICKEISNSFIPVFDWDKYALFLMCLIQ